MIKKYADKLYGLLPLKRRIVGVKIIHSQSEYDDIVAGELLKPLHYCVAVKSAMAGHDIKMNQDTAGCPGGNRALGITPPTPAFYNGKRGAAMGLYRDEQVASNVASSVSIIQSRTYGVLIKPLEHFDEAPDVVLVAVSARDGMRILQGYTYQFGLAENIKFSGNQAVCVECTVTPLLTGDMNVSVMCSGTRYNARWDESELMVGINYKIFAEIVDGIEGTVNPVEADENKARIERQLKSTNNLTIEVEYGKTYYKTY